MKGVRDPQLIQPLLQSLAYDADFNVRRAAAFALVDFLATPGVRDVLARAQASDPVQAVREQAQRSLSSPDERATRQRARRSWTKRCPTSIGCARCGCSTTARSSSTTKPREPCSISRCAAQTIRVSAARRGFYSRWGLRTPTSRRRCSRISRGIRASACARAPRAASGGIATIRPMRAALERAAEDDASAEVRRAARDSSTAR